MNIKDTTNLLQKYLGQITSEFPSITYSHAKIVTHGWDNDVVILDDSFVFRFPKTEEYRRELKAETNLLVYLKDKITIPIPDYKYLSKDESFGGYPIIRGTELSPELLESQSEEVKERVITDLAEFITILHQTPKEVIKEMGISTQDDHNWSFSYITEMHEGVKEKLYPILSKEEVTWIEYQFNIYFSLQGEIKPTLVHNDLTADHIFFDIEKSKISGIIDFTDAEYADPAVDFSGFLDYGEDFMRKVIDRYQDFKDEGLVQRAKFRRLTGMVGNMLKIAKGRELPTTYEYQRAKLHKKMKLFPVRV